jgi:hypothetical protein
MTFSTIGEAGCPKRLCHIEKDGLLTPQTCFVDTGRKDEGGSGYSPRQQGPLRSTFLVALSLTAKKLSEIEGKQSY